MAQNGSHVKAFLVEQACRTLAPLARTRPGPPPHQHPKPNILVIRPASLGDVLMSTAFLATLRDQLPRAQITVLATTWAQQALADNPHIDEVLDGGTVGFPNRYGPKAFFECVIRLRHKRFTHCFVLDRSPLMALMARLAGIPWRAGLDSAHRGLGLHIGVPCPPDRHEAELYLDVARACGLDPVNPRLHFWPKPAEESFARHMLAEWNLTDKFPLVVIHPGGGVNPGETHLSKRWPSASFSILIDRLVRELGAAIIVVGGPEDASAAALVQQRAKTPLTDLTGQLTFGQLAAILRRSHLFIGNDSAPMHLAAAVGTPVVALFGATPPERYAPYGINSALVRFRPQQGEAPDDREIEVAWSAVQRLLHLHSHYEQASF